jgi:hypothetical protein
LLLSHCEHCKQAVRPVKYVSWPLIIGLVILGFFYLMFAIVLAVVYLSYYIFIKSAECPMCRGKDFTVTPEEEAEQRHIESIKMINMITDTQEGKNDAK